MDEYVQPGDLQHAHLVIIAQLHAWRPDWFKLLP